MRPARMRALFGFDHSASDARRGTAGSFAGHGMNHDGGATVGEDGVVVTAECNVRGNYRRVTRAVGGHDQRKIGNVTGGQTDMIGVPGGAVEVRSDGLEVRGLAFRVLMWRECSPGGRPFTSSLIFTPWVASVRTAVPILCPFAFLISTVTGFDAALLRTSCITSTPLARAAKHTALAIVFIFLP